MGKARLMGWCVVPGCTNISLTSGLCPKHRLDQTVKRAHERKDKPMKVKVAEGYQMKDRDGKLHASGEVIDVKDAEGKAAVMNGWATEPKAEAKPEPKVETSTPSTPSTSSTPTPTPTTMSKPQVAKPTARRVSKR